MEKNASTFSFATKLSPDNVIAAAVRFFSSRKYKVQSQSSNWITFEPEKGTDYWHREQIICAILGIAGMILTITLIGAILGLPMMIGGIIGALIAAHKEKLSKPITITAETVSEDTRITIEYPSQEKVKVLVEELASLL